MKIPKYFLKWFQFNGWMNDGWDMEPWQLRMVEEIAWRSYRKGIADAKKSKRTLPNNL